MLKDINIVLDIDSTLINSFDQTDAIYDLVAQGDHEVNYLAHQSYHLDVTLPEETSPFHMWGIYRPHLTEFILYCIENFKNVYIWSAGCKLYVDSVVESIFSQMNYHPPIVLSNQDTYCDDENNVVNKPLSALYKKSKGQANEMNTLIVDDREDTFSSNPDNGILIPRFSFDDMSVEHDGKRATLEQIERDIANDNSLQQLIKWFEENQEELNKGDVRRVRKSDIFRRPVGNRRQAVISPSLRTSSRQ